MSDEASRQFISVTVGDGQYGVDVMAIREIKGWETVTALPDCPTYMRGVIDLRGAIVPILDLRARFQLGMTEAGPRHVIVVVAVDDRLAGILVDGVADILSISLAEVQPVPRMEQGGADGYLSGLVTVDGRMVALLDLGRIFNAHALSIAPAAA